MDDRPRGITLSCFGDALTLEIVDIELTDAVRPDQVRFPPFGPPSAYVPPDDNPIVLWPYTKQLRLGVPEVREGHRAILLNDGDYATFPSRIRRFKKHDGSENREEGWENRGDRYVAGIGVPLYDAIRDYRLFGDGPSKCATSDNPLCPEFHAPPSLSCTFPVKRGLYVSAPTKAEDYAHSDPMYATMFEPVLGGVAVVVNDPDVWIRVRVGGEVQTLHYRITQHEKTHVLYFVPGDVAAEYRKGGCAASYRTAALPICQPPPE